MRCKLGIGLLSYSHSEAEVTQEVTRTIELDGCLNNPILCNRNQIEHKSEIYKMSIAPIMTYTPIYTRN